MDTAINRWSSLHFEHKLKWNEGILYPKSEKCEERKRDRETLNKRQSITCNQPLNSHKCLHVVVTWLKEKWPSIEYFNRWWNPKTFSSLYIFRKNHEISLEWNNLRQIEISARWRQMRTKIRLMSKNKFIDEMKNSIMKRMSMKIGTRKWNSSLARKSLLWTV